MWGKKTQQRRKKQILTTALLFYCYIVLSMVQASANYICWNYRDGNYATKQLVITFLSAESGRQELNIV